MLARYSNGSSVTPVKTNQFLPPSERDWKFRYKKETRQLLSTAKTIRHIYVIRTVRQVAKVSANRLYQKKKSELCLNNANDRHTETH